MTRPGPVPVAMKPYDKLFSRFLTNAAICPRSTPAKAAWVVALLLIPTGLRWLLDPFVRDELPFFLYLPAILIVAAFCGLRAGLTTVAVSLMLTVALWVPPSGSWFRLNIASAVSVVIWFAISTTLVFTIALLQKSALAQRELVAELNHKSALLESRSTRLEESERTLARHAGNLERLVAERTARLEESIIELESFSYSTSHDLRSPIRAMQGFSYLLLDEYGDKLDPTAREYLKRIQTEAQRMDALIADVLSFSSIARVPLVLKTVDVESLIDRIIVQYPLINRVREHIHVERPLRRVHGSESCLVQAVSNLLLNAVKFVRPGESPRVRIWTETRGPNVRLHIADQGIGISAAAFPHVFKPFHRASEAGAYEGTGIGLAIVKRAVERQSGSVGATSELGSGSDFWIELPAAAANPPELPS